MVIIVPVLAEHYDGKPPDVAGVTLRALTTGVSSISYHVAKRVNQLLTVVAEENRCKI